MSNCHVGKAGLTQNAPLHHNANKEHYGNAQKNQPQAAIIRS